MRRPRTTARRRRSAGRLPVVLSRPPFVVTGLTAPVAKATLRVYANSSQSTGYDAYLVSDSTWSETKITYANAPPFAASKLGSSGSVKAQTWTSADVTSLVPGNGTYSLALTTSNSTALSLASREAGANAPQLLIETAAPSVPVNSVLPSIPGVPRQGVSVSADQGVWSGVRPGTVSVAVVQFGHERGQLSRFSGRRGQSYTPASTDVGRYLRVNVTATNGCRAERAGSVASLGCGCCSSERAGEQCAAEYPGCSPSGCVGERGSGCVERGSDRIWVSVAGVQFGHERGQLSRYRWGASAELHAGEHGRRSLSPRECDGDERCRAGRAGSVASLGCGCCSSERAGEQCAAERFWSPAAGCAGERGSGCVEWESDRVWVSVAGVRFGHERGQLSRCLWRAGSELHAGGCGRGWLSPRECDRDQRCGAERGRRVASFRSSDRRHLGGEQCAAEHSWCPAAGCAGERGSGCVEWESDRVRLSVAFVRFGNGRGQLSRHRRCASAELHAGKLRCRQLSPRGRDRHDCGGDEPAC